MDGPRRSPVDFLGFRYTKRSRKLIKVCISKLGLADMDSCVKSFDAKRDTEGWKCGRTRF